MAGELILIVDDERSVVEAIRGVLEDEGYRTESAESGEAALKLLERETPDLILLDVWMQGMDGLATLSRIRETVPELGVIMISGHGTIETAVRATRLGALNFIEKPLSLDKLLLEVRQALKQLALERENRDLKQRITQRYRMVGSSRAMRETQRMIRTAGPSNARVLISGESGTGKELVAREIHRASQRSARTFVEVNCAAIPEDLIESELFGHEKGAFTHAVQRKRGKFEIADRGTLFLDEVGDMSLKTQAKVLRVLEEGRIERVGGSEPIGVDVRVIAASNKDLEKEIRENRFREDLFYRLNVIPIHLAPLRERVEDITDLAAHFLGFFCSEYGKPEKVVSEAAMKILESYAWPGNIRELRNEVERLVIMTSARVIEPEDLRREFQRRVDPAGMAVLVECIELKEAREKFERAFIAQQLERSQWNITQAAESLGIERSNLHRKIKQLGIRNMVEPKLRHRDRET
ncbi:sigma-54-dependent Fis family transcriptional regulator [bacterium]|nr:sigma-54-dependent Fis family transcriptional regulator [candidate division CSSED10-310 bacterium]